MKMTTPGSIGGMKVAIAWPNMWLSGRRFRNRSGENGLLHFRYLRISRSIGTVLASTLAWVMTTPLGSAVAPEVKNDLGDILARDRDGGRRSVAPFHLVQLPDRRVDRGADRRHVLADGDQFRLDDVADAREEIRRGAIVDRDDDGADQQAAPERDHPFRPVLAPHDHFVALGDAELVQTRARTRAPRARHRHMCNCGS